MFGTLNPWVVLAAVVGFVAAVGGAYLYGDHVGTKTERAAWLDRDNKALAATNKRIIELNEAARATERKHAEDLAGVSAGYQKELQDEKAKADRVVSDLRAGNKRLRIAVADSACGSETGGTASGSGGRDGGTRAELSGEAAEFLVGLASEADQVVRQLQACQEIVKRDRKAGR